MQRNLADIFEVVVDTVPCVIARRIAANGALSSRCTPPIETRDTPSDASAHMFAR